MYCHSPGTTRHSLQYRSGNRITRAIKHGSTAAQASRLGIDLPPPSRRYLQMPASWETNIIADLCCTVRPLPLASSEKACNSPHLEPLGKHLTA